MELETGDRIELNISDTTITISGLHPFYHYKCNVSAVTIGAGPYTLPITVQLLQAGMYTRIAHKPVIPISVRRLLCYNVK